ncbi:MAG: TonB-dependent receptor [bacterium]|nr:TonB-dependent receptor [bacterium]
MLRRRFMVWGTVACIIAFLSVTPVSAQSIQYGKLTGRVLLESGTETVSGVTVTVTSEALISGTRTTVSSENGTFVFLNLPMGKYTVKSSLEGFKTSVHKNITVTAAAVTTLDMIMEAGKIQETVAVTASAPVVDVKTSALDSKINKEMLEKLPSRRDAFYDLSLSTPGMFDAGADSSWLPSPTAYGGGSDENVFLVNGVNTTNPRGSSWGSLVHVNYNAVEEVRVVALGSKAEYGSFSGVAVDVLTKSGSNSFHGSLGYYSMLDSADNQPAYGSDLGKDWLYFEEGDELMSRPDKEYETNITLGGPMIKNKIWFYTGFSRTHRDNDTPIFTPLKEYRSSLFDIKLSAEPFKQTQAWVAYHYEKTDNGNESWGDTWDDTMVYDQHQVNHTISTQWQWYPSDRTFFSAKFLGFWTDDEPTTPEGVDHPGYINWWKWVDQNMGVGGAFPYVEAQKSKRTTIQADISHYAEDFLGEHDMKFGVQYTKGSGDWMGGYFHGYANTAYPYGYDRYVADNPEEGLHVYVNRTEMNPFLTVRNTDSFGIFFDDQWSPFDRLTVNLGVRYDRMTAGYGAGKVYEVAFGADELNGPPPVLRDRAGSDGHVFDFKTFSPRIGITYMLTDDGKTVLRANYGRYYSPVSVENLRRFGPDMPLAQNYRYDYYIPWNLVDADGDGYISNANFREGCRNLHDLTPFSISDEGSNDNSWAAKVVAGTKDMYTDQINISIEREVFKNFTAQASYIYKKSGNILANWPINRETQMPWTYERVPYTTEYGQNVNLYNIVMQDFNGDGVIDWGDADWMFNNTDSQVMNMPEVDGVKPERKFQAMQLVLNKHYSNRWQLMTSFLFTKSNGVAPRTFQDWNINGTMIMDGAFVGSLNQLVSNMSGPLPFTPKFEFKLSATYRIPKIEVDLGMRFRYHSGRPVWPMEMVDALQSWTGWLDPDLLATTGGETGSLIVAVDPEKPYYLPGPKIFDLSIGRETKLGEYGSLGLTLDILNVFNDNTTDKSGYKDDIGKVYSIVTPRVIRLSVQYKF